MYWGETDGTIPKRWFIWTPSRRHVGVCAISSETGGELRRARKGFWESWRIIFQRITDCRQRGCSTALSMNLSQMPMSMGVDVFRQTRRRPVTNDFVICHWMPSRCAQLMDRPPQQKQAPAAALSRSPPRRCSHRCRFGARRRRHGGARDRKRRGSGRARHRR